MERAQGGVGVLIRVAEQGADKTGEFAPICRQLCHSFPDFESAIADAGVGF